MPNDVNAAMSPVAETAAGKLRGSASGGIFAFKGVPYGASTAGANRFVPPRSPEPWAGVRDALQYRWHAPQLPGRPEPRLDLWKTVRRQVSTTQSEYCLSVNGW